MSSSTTSSESTSFGGPSAPTQTTSASQPLFASSSNTLSTAGSGAPTLASGTSRTVTETQSVYINTSYIYSPTLSSSSSTAFLPSESNTLPTSSQQTESATRRRTSSTAPPTAPTVKAIVPSAGQPLLQGNNGLLLNLTLAGDDVGQAVYSVPMVFGHPSGSQYYETTAVLGNGDQWKRRGIEGVAGSSGKTKVLDSRNIRRPQSMELRARQRSGSGVREKRAPGTYQSMNLQVDLGSSDLVCRFLSERFMIDADMTTVGRRLNLPNVGLSRQRSAETECGTFD